MRSLRMHPRSGRRRRHGFTLLELLIAGVITALLLGSISMTLGNLGRSKASSGQRLKAFLRADNALNSMRRDIASIIRADDLFYTRFLLSDAKVKLDGTDMDRDELLIFSNRLKPLREIDYKGEGTEYETQFRIEEDDYGPVLWTRRDAFPDEYPAGGGLVHPLVEGIVGLSIEAYNGDEWLTEWDSDEDGMPHAVRLTVTARGASDWADFDRAPTAVLRTTVAIDRILLPNDRALEEEALLLEELDAERETAREAAENAAAADAESAARNAAVPTDPRGSGDGTPPDISDIPIPPDQGGRGGRGDGGGRGGGRGNSGIGSGDRPGSGGGGGNEQ